MIATPQMNSTRRPVPLNLIALSFRFAAAKGPASGSYASPVSRRERPSCTSVKAATNYVCGHFMIDGGPGG